MEIDRLFYCVIHAIHLPNIIIRQRRIHEMKLTLPHEYTYRSSAVAVLGLFGRGANSGIAQDQSSRHPSSPWSGDPSPEK